MRLTACSSYREKMHEHFLTTVRDMALHYSYCSLAMKCLAFVTVFLSFLTTSSITLLVVMALWRFDVYFLNQTSFYRQKYTYLLTLPSMPNHHYSLDSQNRTVSMAFKKEHLFSNCKLRFLYSSLIACILWLVYPF